MNERKRTWRHAELEALRALSGRAVGGDDDALILAAARDEATIDEWLAGMNAADRWPETLALDKLILERPEIYPALVREASANAWHKWRVYADGQPYSSEEERVVADRTAAGLARCALVFDASLWRGLSDQEQTRRVREARSADAARRRRLAFVDDILDSVAGQSDRDALVPLMRAYVRAFRGGARNVDAGVFPSLVEALARAAHVAPEIAEDVAADVLHRHIGRVGARSALLNIPSVAAYLRLSAQRRAGQQARRGMHELVLPEIESSEFESLSIADEAPRAVDAIDLAAAVARLPARQRKDLIAVWLEDRPEVDVASATGRTPQAVSQSVKAGLKNLRKILAGGG